jgi:hypothetical protein
MSRDHIDNCHHIALQIEDLGIQHLHHIDLATTAGALNDVVEKAWPTSEHQKNIGPGVDKPEFHDIDEDGKMTPVSTLAMTGKAKATYSEFVSAGWTDKLLIDHGYAKPVFNPSTGSECEVRFAEWTKCYVCGKTKAGLIIIEVDEVTFPITSALQLRPIDNRTDEDKLITAIAYTVDPFAVSNDERDTMARLLLASDKFTITLKG